MTLGSSLIDGFSPGLPDGFPFGFGDFENFSLKKSFTFENAFFIPFQDFLSTFLNPLKSFEKRFLSFDNRLPAKKLNIPPRKSNKPPPLPPFPPAPPNPFSRISTILSTFLAMECLSSLSCCILSNSAELCFPTLGLVELFPNAPILALMEPTRPPIFPSRPSPNPIFPAKPPKRPFIAPAIAPSFPPALGAFANGLFIAESVKMLLNLESFLARNEPTRPFNAPNLPFNAFPKPPRLNLPPADDAEEAGAFANGLFIAESVKMLLNLESFLARNEPNLPRSDATPLLNPPPRLAIFPFMPGPYCSP